MKTEALLELIKLSENDTHTVIKEKYLQLLAEQERLEKMKRIGAVNPFATKPVVIIPVSELQAAWSTIDSEIKYNHFKATGTILVDESESQTKENIPPVNTNPVLQHLTKERPRVTGRRPPSRKDFVPLETKTQTDVDNTPKKSIASQESLTKDPIAPVTQTQSALNVTASPQKPEVISEPVVPTIVKTPISEQKVLPIVTTTPKKEKFSNPVVSNKQLTIEELQTAVLDAVNDYTKYHTGGNKENLQFNRGQGDGFFSFLRHGAKGLATANALYKSIKAVNGTSIGDAAVLLKEFLGDSSKAYHHHSFTSYLADALAKKGLVTPHNGAHYNQKVLVQEIEQWIQNNPEAQKIKLG